MKRVFSQLFPHLLLHNYFPFMNVIFSTPFDIVFSLRQDLLSSCLSKNMMKAAAGGETAKEKDKIKISLFLSHDTGDDGVSDGEHAVANSSNMVRKSEKFNLKV